MDTTAFFDYPTEAGAEGPAPVGLLLNASEADWDTLLAHTETRRFRPGDVVIRQGETDRAMYLLTEGSFEVVGAPGAQPIHAPSTVGELGFLDGRPRSSTIRALTAGEAHRLGFEAFEALSARHPRLGLDFLLDIGRILSARLRAAQGGAGRSA